ncbi:hypothetical protein LR48_Vigan09g009000 [Vigna angularis]|uniref:Disease resistance R13L4/SHOC-2-like LRR domain-containing protein n=2 Tax=Phaseolus angularis TaxID=3914 RepID=A0A0L9V8M7_PHAAN|nr:disease resistance RPP13-like protein 4 [Vigna angularis]KAG2394418.1 uncharacterized protein HKW66_Vig0182040 [Vigna angularis]KOM51431.1 hypothetical protein LR48_Vigan09g009000 [Vigna angularis]BAT88884.1 hypothetical protein VIGAN_05252300 [Vigna angularis var. angularis]
MSIRTNPMKAVPTLLKRLVTVDKQAKLKDLKSELTNIKDLFSKVKKNEQDLLDKLTKVYGYLRNNNIDKLMEDEEMICKEIEESTKKLLPADQFPQPEKANKEATASRPSTQQPEELEVIKKNYESLGDIEMKFLKSLLHFPKNSVMKRRNIILWWVGVGLVEMEAAKENGEYMFGKLMDHKLILPDKYDFVNKLFKVNPLVYGVHDESRKKAKEGKKLFQTYSEIVTSSHQSDSPKCLALNELKVELSDAFGSKSNHFRSIFNTGASYLIFGSQRMAKMKGLEVLQLGRWLHASPKHHIEVNGEEFLKELRNQEKLKYLSLRGISRISQLPDSIFQLKSLETLDLKACHNLETLPRDIALLKNLKHLNLSQCYLLDRMPKGIDKLNKLEVLKGFVIGSSDKISDLAKLSKLKQLSIHLGSGVSVQDKGSALQNLSALEKLKISWGVFDTKYSEIELKLPQKLKKLHLEGFPGQHIPEWLKPDKITTSLCELYITGGKLRSVDLQGYAHVSCSLQIIRLKYLQHLNIN